MYDVWDVWISASFADNLAQVSAPYLRIQGGTRFSLTSFTVRSVLPRSSYTPTMSLTPLMLDVVKVLTLHMSIAMAAAHSAGGGLAKPLKEKKFWVSFGFQSAALALFWMLLVPNL
eukprot:jgi/Mesvir1/18808/Mv01314-RA.1